MQKLSNLDSMTLLSALDAYQSAQPKDGDPLELQPCMLPPMSPAMWRTMDESLFRSFMSPGLSALVSPAAYDAIRERATALGIAWERP